MFRAGCWVFLCMLILNTGCTICMDKTYDSRQVQSVNGGCLLLVDTWSHLQYTPGFLFVFSWFSFFYRICPIDHYELSSLVLQPEKKHTVADIMLNHLQIDIYFKIQNTDYDTLPAPKKTSRHLSYGVLRMSKIIVAACIRTFWKSFVLDRNVTQFLLEYVPIVLLQRGTLILSRVKIIWMYQKW